MYILPQCHFSHKTLRTAESKSIPGILAKCGFMRTTSYALLFAPTEMAGGGFTHWSTLQSKGQIQHFLKHWRTTTDISSMLRTTLAWSQWQAGISASILSDCHVQVGYIECRWLMSLREALRASKASFRLDQPFTQPPERIGNMHIMDVARRSGRYTATELRQLNYCRLYLHVTTISEILDALGAKSRLMTHAAKCSRPPWFNPGTITVIQAKPTSRSCLQKWLQLCHHLSTVVPHLGQWITSLRTPRLRREAYISPITPFVIYHWNAGCYWLCNPLDVTRFVFINRA
jgi:hypothetical protein